MIVRAYNPVEGGPAIWLDEPIRDRGQVSRLMRRLREYPEGEGPVDVVIAGGGGNCSVGLEMYTALKIHPRSIRVTIFDAPSISGLIAMAGDRIRIVEGGTIFLHPVGYSTDYLRNDVPQHNTALALKLLARKCETTDALHVEIMARRTGLDPHRVAELRAADMTLDAAAALRLGFADEVVSC